MRKMIIFILLIGLSFSQFEAGKKSLGGGIEFSRVNTDIDYIGSLVVGDGIIDCTDPDNPVTEWETYSGDISYKSTTTIFSIAPTAEYFAIDNMSIGVGLSYTILRESSTTTVNGIERASYKTPSDTKNPLGYGFYGKYFVGSFYGHAGYFEPNNEFDADEYLAIGAGHMCQLADGVFIDTKLTYRHMLNIDDIVLDGIDVFTDSKTMVLYGNVGISVLF